MSPRGASTHIGPVRLQTVKKLRIKSPVHKEPNPCLAVMSMMMSCWASSGPGNPACASAEQSLRSCMDGRKPGQKKKSTINYHLARLYPKISGPRKR